MPESVQLTATPRRPRWVDLSVRHGVIQNRLCISLGRFKDKEIVAAMGIVGAYGTGKSELMAWGFHHCWTKLGIPAIFINAETLLKYLPDRMSPSDLTVEVGNFVKMQLKGLLKYMESTERPDNLHLATDLRTGESFADYLVDLFDMVDRDLEPVRKILETKRAVLFLDEIEQKYGELLERVETDDQAPLRELLQSVEQQQTDYYLALSFGLTSAYEAMSGADVRRIDTVKLPLPDPGGLAGLGQHIEYQNLIWWASRGRPGWAIKLSKGWAAGLKDVKQLEDLHQHEPTQMENLPLVDTNTLDVFGDSEANRAVTRLLKAMRPVLAANLTADDEEIVDLIRRLPHNQYLVTDQEEGLVSIEDIADALIKDLQGLAGEISSKFKLEWSLLRIYLSILLTALADDAGRMTFGVMYNKGEGLAKAVIAPLLILLQDMLLEFQGEQKDVVAILEFIDRVMAKCGIVGEQVTETFDVIARFPETLQLVREHHRLDEKAYVCLSPKAVEGLFPRIVGRPLMTLVGGAHETLKEQQAHVEGAVRESSRYLQAQKQHDSWDITFIFIPADTTLDGVQRRYFTPEQRDLYLDHRRIFVLIPLGDFSQSTLMQGENANHIRVLMEDLHKIQWQHLGEKRIKDFITSLWHNQLVGAGTATENNIFAIIDASLESIALSKSDRRKLSYYRDRLGQWLEDLMPSAVRQYKSELTRRFNRDDGDFPAKRIDDTSDKVRENRAIEQVALALDLYRKEKEALSCLFELRQLANLRQLTKRPHAYTQFFDNYTVVGSRESVRPATGTDDIVRFIRYSTGFTALIDMARNFGLNPGSQWEAVSEATENAPLRQLYGNTSSSQDLFIRGISFYSYLDGIQSVYVGKVLDLANEIERTVIRLEELHKEIISFNEALDFQAISTDEPTGLLEELKLLHVLLTKAESLPPAVLYVLFRVTESALYELEKLRHRWSGEQGILRWKARFLPILNWRQDTQDIMSDLQYAYEKNKQLKSDLLGNTDAHIQKLELVLERAARSVLDKLDEQNQLLDPIPEDVDVDNFREALKNTREEVEGLVDSARSLEKSVESLRETSECVGILVSRLGE